MANSNVTIRMDSELKTQLQELMSNLGLDITAFFTMAAKQAVRERALPFHPAEEKYNLDTLKAMAETQFLDEHPEYDTEPGYSSAEELRRAILDEV